MGGTELYEFSIYPLFTLSQSTATVGVGVFKMLKKKKQSALLKIFSMQKLSIEWSNSWVSSKD